MLIGGVVDHQLGDDADAALVGLIEKRLEAGEVAIGRMDVAVVRDVVAVVAQRRGIERQQPYRRDAEIVDVIEPLHEAGKIADAVSTGIVKRFHMQLINDRVLVPVADLRDRCPPGQAAFLPEPQVPRAAAPRSSSVLYPRADEAPNLIRPLMRIDQHVLDSSPSK